jgi:hypothetical protein
MNEVVQAKCPGCHTVLRIPAAWLRQAIRCKHCGLVIQTKQAAAAGQAPATRPAAAPASRQHAALTPAARTAAPVSSGAEHDSFEFVEDQPETAPAGDGGMSLPAGDLGIVLPSSYRGRRGGRWRGVVLAGVVVLAALGVGAYAWHVGQTGDDQRSPNANLPTRKGSSVPPPPANADAFPRRALAVAISNYWYANPVGYGKKSRSVGAVFRRLCEALHVSKDQVAELSDGADQPVAPTKPVIEQTVTAFLDTCRPQDRILLLFVGHAVEIGKEAYLAPIEGELKNKATLLPLSWLYDGLRNCKARQKVLVLDVCRYDPGRGLERPGSGPMGPVLDAAMQHPPAGVQVWSACGAGQYSYEGGIVAEGQELVHGGFFLSEVFSAVGPAQAKRVRVGVQQPADPMPVAALAEGKESVPGVDRATTSEVGEWVKAAQAPRLHGQEPPDGAPYDAQQPAPPPLVVKKPMPAGGGVGRPVIQAILGETGEAKSREGDLPLTADSLPPFGVTTMKAYKEDNAKTPLREAVLRAARIIDKHSETFREEFRGKEEDAAIKKQIFNQQKPVAKAIAEMQDALDELNALEKDLGKEKSKRWKANYEFVRARVQQRMAYLYEYDYVLGLIRRESLPKRDPGKYSGWRLAAQVKIQSGSKSKDVADEARKAFAKMAKKYKDTPWEILAKREAVTNLGLRWEVTP